MTTWLRRLDVQPTTTGIPISGQDIWNHAIYFDNLEMDLSLRNPRNFIANFADEWGYDLPE